MLIQFSFKNFKSFRDDTVLDLSATKITEHSDRVIHIGNEKLLPVAAIFGANASGKSNFIEAFRFMMTYVIESYGYGDEEEERKTNRQRIRLTSFLFDEESRKADSSFEVYYITSEEDGCKSYNYGFSLNQDGVTEEWLNVKAKTAREYKKIFYRHGKDMDLSGLPPKTQKIIPDFLNQKALIVSIGAKMQIDRLKQVRDWFFDVEFANYGDPLENLYVARVLPDGFADSNEVQQNVVNYFASFDPSILGFNVRKKPVENGEKETFEVDAIHKLVGTDKTTSIPLEEESDGTLKMFTLYPPLQKALETGGVLCVDELNARLHPLLVRSFLITFLNPEINKNHAQIIFTTHDAWQLSNNILRRDEIWFTEKDLDGVSTLYSLADFVDVDGSKIRKDESYEKNYLLGKYGAIPTLKAIDVF